MLCRQWGHALDATAAEALKGAGEWLQESAGAVTCLHCVGVVHFMVAKAQRLRAQKRRASGICTHCSHTPCCAPPPAIPCTQLLPGAALASDTHSVGHVQAQSSMLQQRTFKLLEPVMAAPHAGPCLHVLLAPGVYDEPSCDAHTHQDADYDAGNGAAAEPRVAACSRRSRRNRASSRVWAGWYVSVGGAAWVCGPAGGEAGEGSVARCGGGDMSDQKWLQQ